VEVAELYADGHVGGDALRAAEAAAWRVWMDNPRGGLAEEAARAAVLPWAEEAAGTAAMALAGVLADSPSDWNAAYEFALRVASPEDRYQLVAAADAVEQEVRLALRVMSERQIIALLHDLLGLLPGVAQRTAMWPWVDNHAVRLLARAAYEERRLPTGQLDAVRLAALADALEEAGSRDAGLLVHLRGRGPHVRGCWAVDWVLAKE
jgi:hypothetical protein